MKIRILGSAVGANPDLQYFSSYVVNDIVAIDAGSLGVNGSPVDQSVIRHVFLTHAHIDHIAALPLFVENAFEAGREPPVIYGLPETLASLQAHVFNDVIWPDFIRLSIPGREFLRMCPIRPESSIQVEGLSVLPVLVDHTVVTCGYIVTDGVSTVIFGADSAPTERIWQLAAKARQPISVILEACFPNSMEQLARLSRHLTPALFASEIEKMSTISKIIAVHIKPRFKQETVGELMALQLPNLVLGEPNAEYWL